MLGDFIGKARIGNIFKQKIGKDSLHETSTDTGIKEKL
jgi:hypothetical protein